MSDPLDLTGFAFALCLKYPENPDLTVSASLAVSTLTRQTWLANSLRVLSGRCAWMLLLLVTQMVFYQCCFWFGEFQQWPQLGLGLDLWSRRLYSLQDK